MQETNSHFPVQTVPTRVKSHSNLAEGISGCPLGERGDGPDTANEHKDAMEATHDFCSRSGNFMYRHRVVNQENYMRIDKIISNFIKVHWYYQTYSDKFGHSTTAQHRRFLEGRRWKNIVWILVWIHKIYMSKKPPPEKICGQETGWRRSRKTHAGRCTPIVYIHSDDKESDNIIRNAKNWKTHTESTMSCKAQKKHWKEGIE